MEGADETCKQDGQGQQDNKTGMHDEKKERGERRRGRSVEMWPACFMQRCVRRERFEILFEMNLALGIVCSCSSSPRTTVWYQPIWMTRACSRLVIVILSFSVNGLVRKTRQPPTKLVSRSLVARPTAGATQPTWVRS